MDAIDATGMIFSDSVKYVEALNIGKIFIADTDNDKVYFVNSNPGNVSTSLSKFIAISKKTIDNNFSFPMTPINYSGAEVKETINDNNLCSVNETKVDKVTPELAMKAIKADSGLDSRMITDYWIIAGKSIPDVEPWEGSWEELMKRKDSKPQFAVTYGTPFRVYVLDRCRRLAV